MKTALYDKQHDIVLRVKMKMVQTERDEKELAEKHDWYIYK
jgi:hypothetical protein